MPARTPGPPVRIALRIPPPVALSRPRDRPAPAGRAAARRPAALFALHRGPDARRRGARRPQAEREREAGDDRRARRGDHERRRGARDRRAVPRRARADRRGGARREHLGEADRRSASSSTSTSAARTSRPSSRDAAARGNFVRIDMEDSSTTDRTLRALPRAARRTGTTNVGVVLQAYLRRTLDDVAGPRQRAALQGHLRRAGRDRVPGVRGGARELRALPRGAGRAGRVRRDRDARRVPDRRGAAHRRATRPRRDEYEFQMLLGVRPDRADELVARRAPAARLRPVRHALVRVLAAAPAGEPEDRGLRRGRHRRPRRCGASARAGGGGAPGGTLVDDLFLDDRAAGCLRTARRAG